MKSKTNTITILIAMGLIVLAAIPRLYDLGGLGLYGDEETTSLPSRALARGDGSVMPSGMRYLRALPHTWMNSISAKLFGMDNEFSYRITAAIFGILTIPVFFLLCRPLFGVNIAFIAALLLAVSDWHILTSREARMYVPFLFFYITTAFYILRWASSGGWGNLLASAVFFALAVGMHVLGVFVILFFLVPLLFRDYIKVRPWHIIAAAFTFAVVALAYNSLYVEAAYSDWQLHAGNPVPVENTDAPAGPGLPITEFAYSVLAILLLTGAIFGIMLGRLTHPPGDISSGHYLRKLNHYGLAILAAISATAGLLHASLIFLFLFALSQPSNLNVTFGKARIVILILAVIYAAWLVYAVLNYGIRDGIKSLVYFPFPYMVYFSLIFPVLAILSVIAYLRVVVNPSVTSSRGYVIAIFAIFLPFLAVGFTSSWGGLRYLIESYPFILIVAALGLFTLVSWLRAYFPAINETKATVLCAVIVLSGLISGHGLPQAWRAMTLQYGDPMEIMTFGFSVYPDHKSAGEYVKARLNADDIVIVEDALQQYWYIGRVDYWLRDPIKQRGFLYVNKKNEIRDIYVSSQIATAEILRNLLDKSEKKVWIVTSAETRDNARLYMNDAQLDFLARLERMPARVYQANDDITTVYCLRCTEDR